MVLHPTRTHLPAAAQSFILDDSEDQDGYTPLHAGVRCPQCGMGILDYNGLLNLACAACGFNTGGGGGCT